MPIFAVHYHYADGSAAGRDEHRPAHRAFLDSLVEGAAELLASGPYADEPAGALLIFRAESAAEVESELDSDPFAHHGFISGRQVRPWSQSRGPWAGSV